MADTEKPVGDEPKAKKKKRKQRKRVLGPKQQRLIRVLTNADSVSHAGEMAGYGTRQSTHRALQSIRRTASEILTEIGYGPTKALSDLREMADAKETKFWAHQGSVISREDVEANDIRLRARVELNKMHGHYPAGANDPSGNQRAADADTVYLVVTDERRSARLAALLSPSGATGVVIDVAPEVDQNVG